MCVCFSLLGTGGAGSRNFYPILPGRMEWIERFASFRMLADHKKIKGFEGKVVYLRGYSGSVTNT